MSSRAAVVLALLAVRVAAAGASASPASVPGFYGCRAFTSKRPAAVVRPRSIVVACADGNFYLTGIRWSTWGSARAAGAGTGHQNDCTPNCAAGHFHTYPAMVTLTKPKSCDGHAVFLRQSIAGAVYAALLSPQGMRLNKTALRQVIPGDDWE